MHTARLETACASVSVANLDVTPRVGGPKWTSLDGLQWSQSDVTTREPPEKCNSSSFHYLLKVSMFLELDLIEYMLQC